MRRLTVEESRQLEAAEGWLGLGNSAEAQAELAPLLACLGSHPEVLNVQWQVLAAQHDWDRALEIASRLITTAPDYPPGWIHRSYALHELKRTREARDNLLLVVDKFAKDVTICYNLACYECCLGRLDRARRWLRAACKAGDPASIRRVALEDPDLFPLREVIRGMGESKG